MLQKMHSFFFRKLQLITVLLLSRNIRAEAQGPFSIPSRFH